MIQNNFIHVNNADLKILSEAERKSNESNGKFFEKKVYLILSKNNSLDFKAMTSLEAKFCGNANVFLLTADKINELHQVGNMKHGVSLSNSKKTIQLRSLGFSSGFIDTVSKQTTKVYHEKSREMSEAASYYDDLADITEKTKSVSCHSLNGSGEIKKNKGFKAKELSKELLTEFYQKVSSYSNRVFLKIKTDLQFKKAQIFDAKKVELDEKILNNSPIGSGGFKNTYKTGEQIYQIPRPFLESSSSSDPQALYNKRDLLHEIDMHKKIKRANKKNPCENVDEGRAVKIISGPIASDNLAIMSNYYNGGHIGDLFYTSFDTPQGKWLLAKTNPGIDIGNGHSIPLTDQLKFKICHDVAKGLRHLHENAKIIHNDLKFDNVMLSFTEVPDQPGKYQAKAVIIDYGIATKLNQPLGNKFPFRWTAPEVAINRQDPTTQSDIYQLGLLMYAVYTGDYYPVQRMENKEFTNNQEAISNSPKDMILTHPVWGAVSSDMKSLVERMLDPDPSKRPSWTEIMNFFNPSNVEHNVENEFGSIDNNLVENRLVSGHAESPLFNNPVAEVASTELPEDHYTNIRDLEKQAKDHYTGLDLGGSG